MSDRREDRTDEGLARDARAGDLAAFEELVSRYERRIYGFLRARTGSVHDAEDLAQTVFVTAYRKLHRYRVSRPFAAWLFAIARRAAVSHYRSARRREDRERNAVVPGSGGEMPAAERMRTEEEGARIWRWARENLSENQFAVLWLRYGEDRSVAEIARVLGRTPAHVRVLLHRGRGRLAERLRNAMRAAGRGPSSSFAEARETIDRMPGLEGKGVNDVVPLS